MFQKNNILLFLPLLRTACTMNHDLFHHDQKYLESQKLESDELNKMYIQQSSDDQIDNSKYSKQRIHDEKSSVLFCEMNKFKKQNIDFSNFKQQLPFTDKKHSTEHIIPRKKAKIETISNSQDVPRQIVEQSDFRKFEQRNSSWNLFEQHKNNLEVKNLIQFQYHQQNTEQEFESYDCNQGILAKEKTTRMNYFDYFYPAMSTSVRYHANQEVQKKNLFFSDSSDKSKFAMQAVSYDSSFFWQTDTNLSDKQNDGTDLPCDIHFDNNSRQQKSTSYIKDKLQDDSSLIEKSTSMKSDKNLIHEQDFSKLTYDKNILQAMQTNSKKKIYFKSEINPNNLNLDHIPNEFIDVNQTDKTIQIKCEKLQSVDSSNMNQNSKKRKFSRDMVIVTNSSLKKSENSILHGGEHQIQPEIKIEISDEQPIAIQQTVVEQTETLNECRKRKQRKNKKKHQNDEPKLYVAFYKFNHSPKYKDKFILTYNYMIKQYDIKNIWLLSFPRLKKFKKIDPTFDLLLNDTDQVFKTISNTYRIANKIAHFLNSFSKFNCFLKELTFDYKKQIFSIMKLKKK